MTDNTEVWAHCKNGHEWLVCKLPMEAGEAARLMMEKSKCETCGARGLMGKVPTE